MTEDKKPPGEDDTPFDPEAQEKADALLATDLLLLEESEEIAEEKRIEAAAAELKSKVYSVPIEGAEPLEGSPLLDPSLTIPVGGISPELLGEVEYDDAPVELVCHDCTAVAHVRRVKDSNLISESVWLGQDILGSPDEHFICAKCVTANLVDGYDYGDGNQIGFPKEGEDRMKRRNTVFTIAAYRINKSINGTFLDCENDEGDMESGDMKTVFMSICAEMAKVDTLLRANGFSSAERASWKKIGTKFGYDSERGNYDWNKITKTNAAKAVEKKRAELASSKAKRSAKRRQRRKGGSK